MTPLKSTDERIAPEKSTDERIAPDPKRTFDREGHDFSRAVRSAIFERLQPLR